MARHKAYQKGREDSTRLMCTSEFNGSYNTGQIGTTNTLRNTTFKKPRVSETSCLPLTRVTKSYLLALGRKETPPTAL